MNKIFKIIKILNDFYNVVSFKELGSVVEFSSFIRSKELDSLTFCYIFIHIFFSNNTGKFFVTYFRII